MSNTCFSVWSLKSFKRVVEVSPNPIPYFLKKNAQIFSPFPKRLIRSYRQQLVHICQRRSYKVRDQNTNMYCLSCRVYMTTNLSNTNSNVNNDSPPPSLLHTNTPLKPPTTPSTQKKTKNKKPSHHHLKPTQPSVIEIERAIGAGRFRDANHRHASLTSSYIFISHIYM